MAKAPGENDIAIIGVSIVKSTPVTVNAIDCCHTTAITSAEPRGLQKWTRQFLYPL